MWVHCRLIEKELQKISSHAGELFMKNVAPHLIQLKPSVTSVEKKEFEVV